MIGSSEGRGTWGSRFGFVLAAAGSAIGLGNIWRFPYVTGQNGGAAFVLLYILFVVLIGAPVMISELVVGRQSNRNPVGAYKALAPNSPWILVGVLGVVTGIGILSYYSVIAGWTFGYCIKAVSGELTKITSAGQSEMIFTDFVKDPGTVLSFLTGFMILNILVVMGGVSKGIERWAKILMPLLLGLMILLTIRSITLPGASEGLSFYLKPDLSKITAGTVGRALGQALFSLSLGMGAMITYGSYLSKKENLIISAGYVCLFDTLIAIIAGLMTFPALFAMGLDPNGGPGLVFVLLPSIFAKMPGGYIFGSGFFLLLTVAALTSTISLLEVAVSFIVDEWKWKRSTAAISVGSLALVLGVPSALSAGASQWLTSIPGIGLGFLDLANIILGNYSLTLGALLIAIFVAYKWGIKAVVNQVQLENNKFYFKSLWSFLIRYICPVAILFIFVYIIATKDYF